MAKARKKNELLQSAAPIGAGTVQTSFHSTRRNIILYVVFSNIIMHRLASKAKLQLFTGGRTMTKAEKAAKLKHEPYDEYRDCFYRNRRFPDSPALFHLPNGMVHKCLANSTMDANANPDGVGIAKTQIMRWVRVANTNIDFFGIPKLFCSIVRSSGTGRMPDVRTRPCFGRAAAAIEFDYKVNPLTDQHIFDLFGNAGECIGVCDGRPEKSGYPEEVPSPGRFKIVTADDPEYLDIIQNEGREPQLEAFERPAFWDEDTEELMGLWKEEKLRRVQRTDGDVEVVEEEEFAS